MTVGANVEGGGVRFRIWAPTSERVEVVIYGPAVERVVPLEAEAGGYFSGWVAGAGAGAMYRYRLDGEGSYPDPASRHQPEGVHGPSRVVDPRAYSWSGAEWSPPDVEDLVIYELHVGTFTPAGTFAGAAERLPELAALGVSAVELMPVADFPGRRNWGYDGVDLFAPANVYGEPDDLRRFVEAAHAHGLAVILDVVYNHLGPEGNYLHAVTGGWYFTDRHETPWGDAVNVDGEGAEAVRDFIVQNALHWLVEYEIDGLRLDATHAILDNSPKHLLAELTEAVDRLPGRPRYLIAEDERRDPTLVLPRSEGGFGLTGVWADDLHHQVRRLLAGDGHGYFARYSGTTEAIAETLRRGWYSEEEDATADARGDTLQSIPPRAFVHCIQNHDQVGNRARGERLNHQVPPGAFRAASALLLVTPYTPLLWMGQEWGGSSPFQYFTDHPEDLGRLVTEGRREEFRHFPAFHDPALRESIPDPQAEETFLRSRLDWEERDRQPHSGILALYRTLLEMRRTHPALRARSRGSMRVEPIGPGALAIRRAGGDATLLVVVNLKGEMRVDLCGSDVTVPADGRHWRYLLSTEEARFGGDGNWGTLEADGSLHLSVPGAVLFA
jgi:maltooligosyltrehalose trehalohydrolase